ncbi:hypothetical protein ILUMI_13150 [Ignelater luminosus]|uniref:HTH CENPB-type domain-containing protein n=1 Tax=Ignelater luminosus TaxID=2038154 RepID=A0A8K0GBP5_IGNLU|nr:hypothetical protein ILUMI_13150 [Ignelater luminosus]
MKIREASKKYAVPRSTLQDRLHGRVPEKPRRMGPDTILSTEEEKKLVDWIISMRKCGFSIKKDDLLDTVHAIIKGDGRKNPFKNGRPGNKWYHLFLKRNPLLPHRSREGISRRRTVITKESIEKWFVTLQEYLKQQGIEDILDDPTRILNGDEISFVFYPTTGDVIASQGYKNVNEAQTGKEKEAITILLFFSANGEMLPPSVVFPYVWPKKDVLSMPKDWFLGKSDSGRMESDLFYDYIVKGLDNWLLQQKTKKPVVIFVDGRRSHLTMKVSQYCSDNQIILYALPPNSAYIMQPVDVGVFKPLKSEWTNMLRKWRAHSKTVNSALIKSSFCALLNKVLNNKKLDESIKNGFQECGLYPFCSDNNVDYTKCDQDTLDNLLDETQNVFVPKICPEEFQLSDFDSATKVITNIRQNLENSGVDVSVVLGEIEKQRLMLNESLHTVDEFPISIKLENDDNNDIDNLVIPDSDENKLWNSDCF